jgi:hypothetical protein
LASRPPIDLSKLVEKIGCNVEAFFNEDSRKDLLSDDSHDVAAVSWTDIEKYIVESIRRCVN